MAEVGFEQFPFGADIVERLPDPTRVEDQDADEWIADAVAQLAACHHPQAMPRTKREVGLVRDYALARARKEHLVRGESSRETPAADKDIDRAEGRIAAYCAEVKEMRAAQPDYSEEPVLPLGALQFRYPSDLWWPEPMVPDYESSPNGNG